MNRALIAGKIYWFPARKGFRNNPQKGDFVTDFLTAVNHTVISQNVGFTICQMELMKRNSSGRKIAALFFINSILFLSGKVFLMLSEKNRKRTG